MVGPAMEPVVTKTWENVAELLERVSPRGAEARA
jgi:hypothetical protein